MTQPSSATPDPPPGLNILIVDDSTMMRTMIKRSASLTGLPIGQIFEAANGQQALDLLQHQHVDALFTDINMPVMTGIELLRQIAGQSRWQHMVRVVISTDGSEARRHEAGALDVRFYVEKPFRPEVMRDVLSSLTAAR
jgi:two-component system, chemotaxis family, chemotaxis protein CheY